MSSKQKEFFFFIIEIIIAIVVLFIVFNIVKSSLIKSFEFGKNIDMSKPKSITAEVTISEGDDIVEFATKLEESKIINSAHLFLGESFLTGEIVDIIPGTYALSSDMSIYQIFYTASHPSNIMGNNETTITIKEGFTLKDIARYLESEGVVPYEEFIEAANSGYYDYPFLDLIRDKENYLEGYLFPDTYRVYTTATAEAIINRMLSRFNEVFTDEMKSKADALGKSVDEIVTMASIIEEEISVPEERFHASDVIYNRLNSNMELGMCSTVLYVLDKRKDNLTNEDIATESPYNTYINPGLPVGPISNPGLACLEAALNPTGTDYLYFVINDEDAGSHLFTNSYDEFLKAKEEYGQKY
ncbi:MAG: endolytic transglycosylase MltG [Lachnospirales bacterium]